MKFLCLVTIACLISLTIQTTVTSTTTVTLPTVGQFVFTPYSDNKCSMIQSTEKVGTFTSASTCWAAGTTSSVTPTAWNGTTYQLTASLYTSTANCMGTMSSVVLPVDGSCVPSAFQSNLWVTIVYINLPTTATFTFSPFTDNMCAIADGVGVGTYSAQNLCWVISSTTSMVPLRWVGNTKKLALYGYLASGKCQNQNTNSTLNNVLGEITCDGTCLKSVGSNYYKCTVMDTAVITTNSRFLTMGLVAILCFLAIFA
jgi:hypothetical protein